MLESNERILRVTDLARGGAGVGRDSMGRVIFIPFSAPGDLIRVKIVEINKKYAQAELLEILEPSAFRIQPRCPIFGQCGGCEWQHLPYSLQWETKVKGVRLALERVGIFTSKDFDQIPADQIWEYRNRIQLRGQGEEIGFFKRKSRQVVPASRCDIARSEINESWESVRLEGAGFKRPFKVEVEVTSQGEIKRTWNSRHSALGFRQVHDQQNEHLKTWIRNSLSSGEFLLDLFGGSGNLSLGLATYFKEIHCVDISAPRQAPLETPENFYFHPAAVRSWLLKNRKEFQKMLSQGTAILDPPREGIAEGFQDIAHSLEDMGVKEIIAIGCDPDSWARDVSKWTKRGWRAHKVMVIDLFPQTHHVESLMILNR